MAIVGAVGAFALAPAALAGEPLTPPLPVPERLPLPSCDAPYQHVCYNEFRDSSNRPVHRVCVRDDLVEMLWPFDSWEASETCAETEHFAYLPGPGVCISNDVTEKPLVCVNGYDCTVWVVGAWLLCDEIPS